MKIIIKLICLTVLVTGCATTPKTRFADFYKSENSAQLGIAVNTFVVSDISGSDLGINREKNQEAMDLVVSTVQKHLQDRGYQAEVVYKNNGMLFEKQDEKKFFYSEDWKSTGEEYLGPQINPEGDPWLEQETRQFLTRLVEVAKATGARQSSRTRRPEPISADEVPEIIKLLPSDYLVFVNAHGAEIGKGKSIGTGILTGLLSAALTGGMYVYSSTSVSGTYVDFVVFDKEKLEVVWHNGLQGGQYKGADRYITNLLTEFPTPQGKMFTPPAVNDMASNEASK